MVPKELLYTQQHEWVKVENDSGTVGITDHAQNALSDLTYVEVPKVGSVLKKGQPAVEVESAKAAADVYAPAGGTVTQVNTALANDPGLVNKDPYGAGWMYKFKIADKSELAELMHSEEYLKLAPE
jgi:glycine cleavage system H protein